MVSPEFQDSECVYPGLEGFVEDFLADRKKELSFLQQCLDTGEFEAIGSIAHKWKGFCEPYGFGFLGHAARELEVSAQKQSLSACKETVETIQKYLRKKSKMIMQQAKDL